MKIQYLCIECRKKFSVFLSRSKRGEVKFCSRKCKDVSLKGKKPHNYKGGKTTSRGYKCIHIDGKYIFEHRLIMEKELGRKLTSEEVVHHLNGVRADNRPENLAVMLKNLHDQEGRTYILILQERIRHLESILA